MSFWSHQQLSPAPPFLRWKKKVTRARAQKLYFIARVRNHKDALAHTRRMEVKLSGVTPVGGADERGVCVCVLRTRACQRQDHVFIGKRC